MFTSALVLVRILANPLSNLFQKQLTHRGLAPLPIIAFTHAGLTLLCLPVALWLGLPTRPDFWFTLALCAALAVASNVLLVYALRESDLSLIAPLNAYKAVIGVAAGALLLGEIPTLPAAAGIALIVAGSTILTGRRQTLWRQRGIQLRFAALLLSATEAAVLKRSLYAGTPAQVFLWWSILGLPFALAALRLLRLPLNPPTHPRPLLWLTLSTGLMQLTTIYALGRLPVGNTLALFQLSSLVSVFLGYRYFTERDLPRRLLACLIMIAGATLIVTAR